MAEAGDNIKAENERKSLFFHHLRKRISWNADIKEAQESKKLDGKIAQADGYALDDLDKAITAIEAEDKSKITDSYIRHGEILEWLGLVPSFEPDMFRDRMPAVEKREKQGELAGLANKPRESGFSKGGDDDQAWLRGFDRGQATFNQNIGPAMEKAEQGRQAGKSELIKKRGRPAKAKPSAAGQEIEGDTPDSVKQAAVRQPAPPKPSKISKPEEDLTNAELETLRQGRTMFTQ